MQTQIVQENGQELVQVTVPQDPVVKKLTKLEVLQAIEFMNEQMAHLNSQIQELQASKAEHETMLGLFS